MDSERLELAGDTWQRSLGRKVAKTALVLVLLTAFAQWYLPYRGQCLGARPEFPREYWDKETILLRERIDWREMLNDPEEPYKGRIWDNGMRCSRPIMQAPRPKRALVVGCSCTWGLGVNDSDTYVWKLNEMVPDTDFDNAGMVGYGPYRCLEAIRYYMQKQHYDLVIYSAIGNHMFRDTRWYDESIEVEGQDGQQRKLAFVRAYCKLVPTSEKGRLPKLEYRDLHRVHWPGDGSLYLINFAKAFSMHLWGELASLEWNKQEFDTNIDVHNTIALRLRLIVNDMYNYVRKQGAQFVFVSLDGIVEEMVHSHLMDGKSYRELEPRFPYLEAKYPQDFHTTEGLHTPVTKYDNGDHPIPKIHTYFARKIADFLGEVKY